MKKFIKKHRYTIILLLAFILIVILGFKIKEIFIPDEGKATYGERLKDINNHPIDKTIYDKIKEDYEKNDNVIKFKYRLQGKVLNIFLTFEEKVSPKDAKTLAEKIIEYFDEDVLNYYSIQFYLIKEDEKLNNFPIMGMKDPLSKNVVWIKDREITVSDSDEE